MGSICSGNKGPEKLFISGVDKRGIIGEMARQKFLMSRPKIKGVTMLKDLEGNQLFDEPVKPKIDSEYASKKMFNRWKKKVLGEKKAKKKKKKKKKNKTAPDAAEEEKL